MLVAAVLFMCLFCNHIVVLWFNVVLCVCLCSCVVCVCVVCLCVLGSCLVVVLFRVLKCVMCVIVCFVLCFSFFEKCVVVSR